MESPPELIEVRPDEQFDQTSLWRWLQGRLPGAEGELTVRQFSGGKANLTYLLRFGPGSNFPQGIEYVLRRPPLGSVAPGSHDMGREFEVLSQLWRVFPYAARAQLFCPDISIIGAPFFIMDRKEGLVVRQHIPPQWGGGKDSVINRRISEVIIDTLVEFHAVNPVHAGLADLGRPEGFLTRQVQGWTKRWAKAKHEENPTAEKLSRWLRETIPTSPAPTLLHNDWRLDNMALDPSDPSRCAAIYDWDMATRGDPLADLGTLLAVWYGPGEMTPALNPMPTETPGFMSRAEAIRRYGERSGRDVSQAGWYMVFGTFKMAVILQQIYIRWLRGQTEDQRFSSLGEGAKWLFDLANTRKEENG